MVVEYIYYYRKKKYMQQFLSIYIIIIETKTSDRAFIQCFSVSPKVVWALSRHNIESTYAMEKIMRNVLEYIIVPETDEVRENQVRCHGGIVKFILFF